MALAPLNNQVIFKKLFQDIEILQAFIKDLIGIDFEPEKVETEKKFDPPIGNIDIELDIFAEDPKQRVIIEIQRIRYDYHFDRFLHYYLAAIVELAKSYKTYALDRTVYTIVWLTRRANDPLYQHSLVTTAFHSVTDTGRVLSLFPHTLYFLNPFYPADQLPPALADWLQLVAESIEHPDNPQINEDREVIRKATHMIDDDGLTPQERALLLDEIDYENKRKTDREDAKKEQALETARKMLVRGYVPDEIHELTRLSAEEIAALAEDEEASS